MAGNITSGMDIGQVKQLATLMTNAANEIQGLSKKITGQLHNTPWAGPDRNRFESDWTGQHVSQLNTVIQALNDAARIANQNAAEQDRTSNS